MAMLPQLVPKSNGWRLLRADQLRASINTGHCLTILPPSSLLLIADCWGKAMRHLEPKLNLLSQEYVLIQAWKKTSAYIRYHNWFADTLELDRTAADLPRFIGRLARRLRTGRYELGELSIVPAPKSHPWSISKDGKWRPLNRRQVKIRPLAQVPLADQVVATAILLCLSERVETTQGNPVVDVREPSQRTSVSSYGNRLFCDFDPNRKSLVHRWASLGVNQTISRLLPRLPDLPY
jgi:hypothetical protein